ncbi:MAG TPA: SDR family NAD(P)-dependent oxidoreductase [Gammaproteobacteria bacterium]|nr:SDR family NAD(P)-dependent oxidoreductase [Gammaproteobacteria bacterium]
MADNKRTVVVAGVGAGLGDEICKKLVKVGYRVVGLSRSASGNEALAEKLGAHNFFSVSCDLTDVAQVDLAISKVEEKFGMVSVYVHNAAYLHMQAFVDTPPTEFESLWRTVCLGAVHGTQRVLPSMLEKKSGVILFIGATASVKAGADFSAFSSAKFALRGLSQSMARELGPSGIHVAHLVIDGVMWGKRAKESFGMSEGQCLKPASVAKTCEQLIGQDQSAWTHELDIRPAVETF